MWYILRAGCDRTSRGLDREKVYTRLYYRKAEREAVLRPTRASRMTLSAVKYTRSCGASLEQYVALLPGSQYTVPGRQYSALAPPTASSSLERSHSPHL